MRGVLHFTTPPFLFAGVSVYYQHSYNRKSMNQAIETVLKLVSQQQKFVLTSHVFPDGDAIGSEVALAEWLIAQEKNVSVINCSSTPPMYMFIDPNHRIRQFSEQRDLKDIAEADVIILLDANTIDRVRSMKPYVQASKAIKVCIDHHLNPSPFADHYVIDDQATSTGEILYRLVTGATGPPLPSLIASALYCAIMTDTGSFRYPRVDAEIHRIVARLIEWGADPVEIYSNTYEQWSPGRIHLLGEILSNLKIEYGGRLAHITITQEMLKRTGTTPEDTDNFTTYPMTLEGVVVGVLFLELANGIKASFRSKGELSVSQLAGAFGGGGHQHAAGTRISDAELEPTRRRILDAAPHHIAGLIPA